MTIPESVENLVGRKFGRLEVISYQGMNASHATKWLCRCDCGREKTVLRHSLLSGTTWRCGRNCPFDTGMVPGRTFGALTLVRKLTESASQEGERWLCRCECGNEYETTTRKLRRHVVTSCGCGANKRRESSVNDTRLGMLSDDPPSNNETGVRGVSLYAGDGKYHAAIRFRGVRYSIGTFERLEDARWARRECERLIWGPALKSNGEECPSQAECRQVVRDVRRRYQQRAVRMADRY